MLPPRNGVGPSCVALPGSFAHSPGHSSAHSPAHSSAHGAWPRLIDFLVVRFPHISEAEWTARMARGDVVDEAGKRIAAGQAYRPNSKLYYYRSLPPETSKAPEETVLFEDDLLVVADKPHFLPVTPSGKYLQETLLVRLRRRLGIDDLAPLHRIDRETAGVVLFAKQAATRKHYTELFANRAMRKTYQAIAPWRADLQFPLVRQSVVTSADHIMQMREVAANGEPPQKPNAHTTIELLQIKGALARYRLRPLTGKRHQLRVHMAALGMPIVGDMIYPTLLPEGSDDDPGNPLRLLAEVIAFRDPVTGEERSFASNQTLSFPG